MKKPTSNLYVLDEDFYPSELTNNFIIPAMSEFSLLCCD